MVSVGDIFSVAIEIARGIQLVTAALKGQGHAVMCCRQLVQTCKTYEDCVTAAQTAISRRLKSENAVEEESGYGTKLGECLQFLQVQAANDTSLLTEIEKEVHKIVEKCRRPTLGGRLMVALSAVLSERDFVLSKLEAELNARICGITAFMTVKLPMLEENNAYNKLLRVIKDPVGMLFWTGHFKMRTSVSFAEFLAAYQPFLSQTFLIRKIHRSTLAGMLRHTLLNSDCVDSTCVSVDDFALWLRRFGPMNCTFTKSAAVTLTSGAHVPWFVKTLSSEEARCLILSNIQQNRHNLSPKLMFVLRYSASDPAKLAVSSVRHNTHEAVHILFENSEKGYIQVGSTFGHFPTILDAIQFYIFDQIISKWYSSVVPPLGRDSIDQWNAIIDEVTCELPDGAVYSSISDYYDAASSVDVSGGSDWEVDGKKNSHFSSLFGMDASTVPVPIAVATTTNYVDDFVESVTPSTSIVPVARLVPNTDKQKQLSEVAIAGKYMVSHGLDLLLQSGHIEEETMSTFKTLLDRLP